MDQNYKGLSNIGATCYMNSLLQTLYMTPQFRQAIYEWKYNQRIHPKQSDSILYQLQKLFGKLDRKFPGQISTKQLVKSFQWQDQQAQMQQDIQQFNRVLFQALQKSLKNKKNNETHNMHFVRDLYEGEMIHYTHCNQCNNESQKQQIFQDIILTVKNIYQKVYNNCIQLGLQRYMKPQILDKDNMYNCQVCDKKVMAERGVRFLKIPKLLNIILRRFDFDYFTFQRIKVNDRVQFPHILNMNNYMNGYDNIHDKKNQYNNQYFNNKEIPQKFNNSNNGLPSVLNYKKVPVKKKTPVTIAGKITTKPSATTKSFLAEMRKKKTMTNQVNQDLLFVSGNAQMKSTNNNVTNTQNLTLSQPVTKQTNLVQQNSIIKQEKKQSIDTQKNTINIQHKQSVQLQSSNLPILPPILDLPPPQISQPYKKLQIQSGVTVQQQLSNKMLQKQKNNAQKQQKLQQLSKKNKQLILQYLKQGDLVYQLYSVLVHNGSATHGHYYSYIKSFQDQKWYCFNDQRVTQINVEDIQKTYGGIGHSNAYALYYRQVDKNCITNSQNNNTMRNIRVPKYIQKCVEQQVQKLKTREREKIQNLQNILILKIYYQLSVKMLQIHKNSTLQLCLTKARQMFDIPQSIPLHNTRLRLFNPVSETKLQTFQGRQNMGLQQLKILSYKSLLLQVKKQNQVFQSFVLGKINLRIALWQQCKDNIKSLNQQYLKLHKISVTKGSIMSQVQKIVKQKRKQILNINNENNNNICIVKRHQNDEYSYHEIINLFDYKQKNIDQLMVMQNQILFIQQDSNKLMWPIQFDNQLYRITIKYVNGENGKIQNYLTDSRKTLEQLKNQLCTLLNFNAQDTIIRRGNRSGMQLKNLITTMKDLRFISGTQVYLEKGLPAKPGQVRIQLFLATDAPDQCYNRLHQFQFIADVPINGQCKASQIKQLFVKILKKYKNIDYKINQFRIRQKVCDKIGKIYRQKPMKQQQLIQKRQIAIQFKSQGIDCKEYKDFLIYVKVWDPQNWTLSKKIQINVSKTTTMKDLANFIYKQNQNILIQQMEICRILSINKFNILDLCQMEYYQMTDASVIAEPLFVNADGLMFVIKSSKKQPRNLTKEEQTKFGGNIKPNVKTTKGLQNQKSMAKKQKGVTIKVVQNNEHDEKQIEENAQEKK